MKSDVRLLPRLDQLYLQKKSYQVHKKKLDSIRRSSSFSKKSLSQSKFANNQQQILSQKSLKSSQLNLKQNNLQNQTQIQIPATHMQTIQQAKPGLSYWLKKMNPLQKRIKQQQIKQNKRHRQKIKNTMSFVKQSNKIQQHGQHYSGIKKMLSKFSVDCQNNKTKLKCQIVLKKITQVQKEKLKLQQSRIMQFLKKNNATQKLQSLSNRQQQSFLSKRSKKLSEKINFYGKQTSISMKDNSLNNSKKQLILPRNKSQLTSKTNSLVKNIRDFNGITPNLNASQRYSRTKTQQAQRKSPNRLFNNSKLSSLSTETAPQKPTNLKDYKILKVNFTQPGSFGFKKIPSLQSQQVTSKQKINIKQQINPKKYIANRIRTQQSQVSKTNSLVRQGSITRFDYQKKRIERYLKSKSSLTNKQIVPATNKIKNSLDVNKKSYIVQQKVQQSLRTNVAQQKQRFNDKKQSIKSQIQQQKPTSYFATQIQ